MKKLSNFEKFFSFIDITLVAGTIGGNAPTFPYLSTTAAITREQIESIEIVRHQNIPPLAVSYDVSLAKNGKIMLWYEDFDNNGLYEVYIGSSENICAHSSSNYLFANLTN